MDQSSQWYKLQYPDCFVSEEQRMIQKTVADFVDREILPVRDRITDEEESHREVVEPVLKKLQVDLGFQYTMIPRDYGGNEGLSIVTGALKQEQLSRGDYGISLASACVDWGLAPATMAYFSPSPKLKAWGKAVLDEFAPKFMEKELRIACFNMSEPDSACDIENHLNEGRLLKTRAVLQGDEWVINGTKHWASNSGIADLHCVVCNLDPRLGVEAFTLVYVPEPWPGVSHGRFEYKCGINADRNTSTFFDNVRVPKEWGVQGPEAWEIFLTNVVSAFAMNIANCVGMLQGAFDVLLKYTGERVVGGRPVREHLSTAMFLGEMIAAISMGRAAFLEICHQFDHPEVYGSWITDSMVAKSRACLSYIARTANDLISRGMEFMGAYGYVREGHYEKYYRDIAGAKLVLGGVQLGFFSGCRQYYDLDFSSFGPGKLPLPGQRG
ncbi:MAG: acyl-CoA dehydrogenase family protein [Clostridia bacterium]|jgi:alkylation response protein AidB-like acyl-CoA dehydrogenase|nr:acyl-CoA/acyl-ACP dehydrogenase [Clostridia bacterium]MDH7573762.1 acyl-CoA dehydrogenase family protein [Clostridia bacterium]